MTKEQKKNVISNYSKLKTSVSIVNKYNKKAPKTDIQKKAYEDSKKAINESLKNIKKSDLEFGMSATQKVINNKEASVIAYRVGTSTLMALGLSVATGRTWIPIALPDMDRKPAQKAIDEMRSTYK